MGARFEHALEECANEAKFLKVDALPNVLKRASPLFACMWLVVFALSACACTFLIVNAVAQFNERAVTTTIRYLSEPESVVPTLTLCNTNPFTSDFALDLLAQVAANSGEDTTGGGDEQQPVDYWQQYLLIEEYMNATRGYYLTDEEKLDLANLNRSVIPLLGHSYSLEHIFHPKYFGCVRFNPSGALVTNSTSDFFQALLYTGGVLPAQSPVNPGNTNGFYLFIQNSTDDPLATDRNPILLTTGVSVRITLTRTFYEQYHQPYSECGVLAEENALVVELPDHAEMFKLTVEGSSGGGERERANRKEYAYTRKSCMAVCAQCMK